MVRLYIAALAESSATVFYPKGEHGAFDHAEYPWGPFEEPEGGLTVEHVASLFQNLEKNEDHQATQQSLQHHVDVPPHWCTRLVDLGQLEDGTKVYMGVCSETRIYDCGDGRILPPVIRGARITNRELQDPTLPLHQLMRTAVRACYDPLHVPHYDSLGFANKAEIASCFAYDPAYCQDVIAAWVRNRPPRSPKRSKRANAPPAETDQGSNHESNHDLYYTWALLVFSWSAILLMGWQ
jgi:hypothetical protein